MYKVHYYKYLSAEQKKMFLQHLKAGGHNGFQHCMNIQREVKQRTFFIREDAEKFRDTALKDSEDYQCIEGPISIIDTSSSYDAMLKLTQQLAEENLRLWGLKS
ncbi:hypothetical protein LX64_05185 [Chitinophaga skermanii]|uniref:Uncharacterized protein n=1 Tax=Chitinophaga skermanii TaxID=331697 RepID=A0A327PXC9_9BACT|nr:hypothetical protein [Chitinophaga skermanii]RAI96985.1 hypothetical protein LX64_05185 [Chitinophaga skermanii]